MFMRSKVKGNFIKLKAEKTYLSPADRDLVLILGETGNGQSTFANFMAGMQGKMKSHEHFEYKPGQKVICKTGFTPNSVTIFPQVVSTDKGLDLLDCPGIDATPHSFQRNLIPFATHHAIAQAKSIKGIVIILDYSQIKQGPLNNLFGCLEKMIPDFYQQKDSIHFFVNKAPINVTASDILKHLAKRVDDENNRNNGNNSKQMLYTLIKNNPDMLDIFDPTNESQRELFIEKLKALKPLENRTLKILGYTDAKNEIDKDIESLKIALSDLRQLKLAIHNEGEDIEKSASLDKIEKFIHDCNELIALKSLLISLLVETNQTKMDEYKKAYAAFLDKKIMTLNAKDFNDAGDDIKFERIEALTDKLTQVLKEAFVVMKEHKEHPELNTYSAPASKP